MNRKVYTAEKLGYALILIAYVVGIILYFTNDTIYKGYVREDGLIEMSTALFLFATAVLSAFRLFKYFSDSSILWKLTTAGIAVLFVFGAGEEISWGQRIFDIESSEFFKDKNAQGETNIHNLVVGGYKLNQYIFTYLFMLVASIYLLIFPIFYRKKKFFKNLVDKFAVPLAKPLQSSILIFSTLLLLIIHYNNKWELFEFGFSVIAFLIVLHPLNDHIYTDRQQVIAST